MPESLPTQTLVRYRPGALTARDIARPLFRHRRAALLTSAGISATVVAAGLLLPRTYTAEMKVLVKHERVDPVVSGDREQAGRAGAEVTETEINSEVELLKGRDLLESTARAAGLIPASAPETAEARRHTSDVVSRLDRDLAVKPVRKTTLIAVSYSARDPQLASRVLSELSRLYLEKHLTVHRPAGARQFFTDQADRLRRELQEGQQRLIDFSHEHDVVSASAERDTTLHSLAEFEATLQTLRAQHADASRRAETLTASIAATPARQTTVLRRQDNGELMRDLRTKVLDLELKRTELARKFTDTYPPVVELDTQLRQARTALDAAEQAPVKEETTDQNPTHQWLRSELSRVEAERDALTARIAAVQQTIAAYRGRARTLDDQSAREQELRRAIKASEDNYLLYQRKEEEARIADAMDRTRIANVTLAEEPTPPAVPVSRAGLVGGGVLIALLLGTSLPFALDFFTPYFRSRDDVYTVLAIPVLAALPGGDAHQA
jgi:uncharacterized protein involved in exopolysaccharide biosynthesis